MIQKGKKEKMSRNSESNGLGVRNRHDLDMLGMEGREEDYPTHVDGAAAQFERFLAAHGVTYDDFHPENGGVDCQLAPPRNTAGICWDGEN